jgi:outer membrane protein assembly factor BamB
VAGGIVYVGDETGTVRALDAVAGRLRWTYTTRSYVGSGPAVACGTVDALRTP